MKCYVRSNRAKWFTCRPNNAVERDAANSAAPLTLRYAARRQAGRGERETLVYNLLVSGDPDAWKTNRYELERSRVASEYTVPEIAER